MDVVYLGINDKGKRQLSRKQALEGGGKPNGSSNTKESSPAPTSEMSEDELDVIAKAIEGITNQ